MRDAAPAPHVSVIVSAQNASTLIRECLDSLLRMAYPVDRREILVVDSGSDITAEIVRRYPVRYLRGERPGIAHARNRGIRASQAGIVAFTDADCVVSSAWLRELTDAFRDGVGVVGGEIVPFPGTTPAERYAARRASHSQRRPMSHPTRPFAMTPNMAFRREALEEVGLFDTRFPGGGWEDADLCWRVAQGTGLRLGYAPRAVVFHRYRTTAAAFFVQHLRYGYGLGLIDAKYREELPRDWRERARGSGDLARAAGALVGDVLWSRPSLAIARRDLHFDFLRVLGQRVGFWWGARATTRRSSP